MPKPREKLEGKRFGRLLILEVAGKRRTHYMYRCQCDCGNTKIMPGTEIKNRTSVSCGCWARESLVSGRNKKPLGEASKRYLFNLYKARAKNKGFIFSLTYEEFLILTSSNCHYCGEQPSYSVGKKNSNGDYIYNGIDRKRSSSGYTTDNSLTCCGRCNQAKNNMSYSEFGALIAKIYFHSVQKQNPQ